MPYRLERTQLIPRPPTDVFAFFADASNLLRITPPLVVFDVLTPMPIVLALNTLIEYRLRLWGIPVHWTTRINLFDPPHRFVDIQLAHRGPYKLWRHTHEFEPHPDGTLMRDTVDYDLPLGPLGAIAHALFVRRSLTRIFDYRQQKTAELLTPHSPP